MTERRKLCLNMISSHGSGKTTILCRTASELKGKVKIGVIEGYIDVKIFPVSANVGEGVAD